MHGQAPDPNGLIAGADPSRPLDAVFVNAPLRDYSVRPRVNDFTLPVLGMAYIATYAADSGYNVGVLDAEACGLGISDTVRLVNEAAPPLGRVQPSCPDLRGQRRHRRGPRPGHQDHARRPPGQGNARAYPGRPPDGPLRGADHR